MKHKTLLKKLKANGWNMRFDAREQALIKDIAEITENESISMDTEVGMPKPNPSFGQWISVKDKFPDEDIPVLVRVKKPLGKVGRYTVNRWTSYTDQNKEWFNKHFSHWMPLPKENKCLKCRHLNIVKYCKNCNMDIHDETMSDCLVCREKLVTKCEDCLEILD